jgi:MFS family permease
VSRVGRVAAPLRERRFAFLFGGQLTSNLGDACYAVALPWYVLAGRGGPLLLGTVLAAYGIPRIALLAVGGRASDRFRPWTVMMVADVARAAATLALAIVAGLRPPSAWTLVPIAIVLGAGEGLFLPGSYAIVPSFLEGVAFGSGRPHWPAGASSSACCSRSSGCWRDFAAAPAEPVPAPVP